MLALGNLRDAVARGGAFATELAALQAVLPDHAGLAALDARAQTGIATRRALEAGFGEVLPAILAAARSGEDAGLLAKLWDSASGIVTVRPIGTVAGDSPEAVVARIENMLAEGNLAGALESWDALPQPARAAGQAWAHDLAATVSVEQTIDKIGRDLASGLGNGS